MSIITFWQKLLTSNPGYLSRNTKRARRRVDPIPPAIPAEVRVLMSSNAIVSALDRAGNDLSSAIKDLVNTASFDPTQPFHSPGTVNQTVTIDFRRANSVREHTYEMGLIPVDNATGKIGTLNPGDDGYAKAALESAGKKVLFTLNGGRGERATVSLPGNSYYILYLVQDGTAADVVAKNADNASTILPFARFSLTAANSDDSAHLSQRNRFRIFDWNVVTPSSDRRTSDLSFGIRVSKPKDPPDTTAPKATLSVSGTIAPTRSLQVQFSEPMKGLSRPLSRSALRRLARTNSDSAANLANYTLTRTDGTAQVISIHRVTRVDKSSVQINFETPLVAGTYRLDISPVLADLAGNAISDPKSFTFTVA